MSTSLPDLTTTSYAMLGMLAIRPWTTYELAKQMTRSLDRIWPRARSNLYTEPKKLVAHGLASASHESVGKRPRTVYSITPKGRRALRRWLATPGNGPVVEFEQLLKLFFADQGTKQDAIDAVNRIRLWAAQQSSQHVAVARSYLAGTGPFPDRVAVLALTGGFLVDFADMVQRWADDAAAAVAAWPEDVGAATPDWKRFEDIARRDRS